MDCEKETFIKGSQKGWFLWRDSEKDDIFVKGSQKRHDFYQMITENIGILSKDHRENKISLKDHGKSANYVCAYVFTWDEGGGVI